MSVLRVLVVVAPLRLTVWVLAVATVVILVLIAFGISRHAETVRADRRREHVRRELEPVFSRFLRSQQPVGLGEQLRPAFLRMNAAHRPVAAVLITELMSEASPHQRDQLRDALEEAGIVELGHRGTRRLSPWRRALACEMLGRIDSRSSVPFLLDRLGDRRPEVRMAAVQALGDIGSAEALPALGDAFLARRVAPTDIVMDALRRIGGEAMTVFERGWRRRTRSSASRRASDLRDSPVTATAVGAGSPRRLPRIPIVACEPPQVVARQDGRRRCA